MTRSRSPVVVGLTLDGASQAALVWAARYARLNHAPLKAIHVSAPPPSAPSTWTPGFPRLSSGRSDDSSQLAATVLRRSLQQADPSGEWTLEMVEGAVGLTLVDASYSALVLVIGTGTHRGLQRLVHGSVSHYCLTRAGCPVVAVGTASHPPAASQPPGDVDRLLTSGPTAELTASQTEALR